MTDRKILSTDALAEMVWRRTFDENSFEHCAVNRCGNEREVIGHIVAAAERPFLVQYRLLCPATMDDVLSLEISCREGGTERRLEIFRNKLRRLVANSGPEFPECDAIDIEWTPLTNIFPIRRLAAETGSRLEISALWVRLPSLEMRPTVQLYERLTPNSVRYTNLPSGFSAIISLDPDGIPRDYEGIWTRLARWSAS